MHHNLHLAEEAWSGVASSDGRCEGALVGLTRRTLLAGALGAPVLEATGCAGADPIVIDLRSRRPVAKLILGSAASRSC